MAIDLRHSCDECPEELLHFSYNVAPPPDQPTRERMSNAVEVEPLIGELCLPHISLEEM